MQEDATNRESAFGAASACSRPSDAGEHVEDTELLRRFVDDKSEEAFGRLVHRHLNLVYSVALRQVAGDAHLAQDVTQQVFTALARKAAALTGRSALSGWLYRSAQFAASDVVRAERRRRAREQEVHAMNSRASESTRPADWDTLRPLLDAAISELDERDRDAVALRFFEGRSLADVGARLRLTENAARMRVDRALDKLRSRLARHGVTSTAAALATALANQVAATVPAGLAATVTGAALASAGGTATAAMTLLSFMTTTKLALGAAAIVAILALGTAGYKVQAQRQAAAALTAIRHDYDLLVAKSRDLERRATAAEQEAAQLKASVEALPPVRAGAKTPVGGNAESTPSGGNWNPLKEGFAFLERHPEVKQAIFDNGNAMINFKYGPLFESLGLTPPQIRQFQDIVREGWLATTAITIDGKSGVLSFKTGLSQSEQKARVRELLGDDGFQEYQRFRTETVGARVYTAKLAEALCFSEAPLTVQQSTQLTEIIAAGFGGISLWATANPAAIDAIGEKARGILSASQLPAWEAIVETWRKNMATDKAIRAAQSRTPAKK